MKKIKRTSILSLTFILAFMFMTVLTEDAAARRLFPPTDKGHGLMQGKQIQAKHKLDGNKPFVHLNKHDLTLKMGETYTLKASLQPGGKSVTVKWYSSNPMIAWVSNTGKVTATAPGVTIISVYFKEYDCYYDHTGYSIDCYVTVPGGAEDAKPLGANDWTHKYGNTTFNVPTTKHRDALDNVKKSLGGYPYSYSGCIGYYQGRYESLLFGSKNINKAHTEIYITSLVRGYVGYGFVAREKSPIKTNRGIAVGSKKNAVLEKYGFPTEVYGACGQENYTIYGYLAKAVEKNMYTGMYFFIDESKDAVAVMNFYWGQLGC